MKKTKKIIAIVLGCSLLLNPATIAHASMWDDDIPTNGIHNYKAVGHANCSSCHNTNATLYRCSLCPTYLGSGHYVIACSKCGNVQDYGG